MGGRMKWFLGFCFLAMVGCVAWALGPDFIAAVRSHTWRATPCVIARSQMVEAPSSGTGTRFALGVEYTYTFQGQEFHSTRFTTGERQDSSDVARMQRAAVRFAAGTRAICFVNPREPAEAVLERGELWGRLVILAPLLILGLVTHESVFTWFDRRRRRKRRLQDAPLSETNDAFRAEGRRILFGSLGLIMGVFLLGFCVVGPLWRWWQSRDWVQTQATITRCELTSQSSQHGPTYSLELTYDYEAGGQHYRSDRRKFGMGIDEPVADLSAWVAAHPPGTKVRCFVAPEDPTEAVLEPGVELGWVSRLWGP
jgi:hypothetical protein